MSKKPITELEPRQSFESVDEALAYCRTFKEPLAAAKGLILSNMDMDEFGFASELCCEAQTL